MSLLAGLMRSCELGKNLRLINSCFFIFQQPPPSHLGVVRVSGLGATSVTATTLSSDSDTSRKRALGSDDNDDGVGSAKRQCVEGVVVEKGFDDVIAEIVAVIDEESKMLG